MKKTGALPSIRIISLLSFFSCLLFVQSTFSETPLEKEKSEIVRDLETLDRGLEVTRGCVERATTEEELRGCREEDRIRQYYEVIDKLDEIGLTVEERRIKRLERRR